MPEGHRSPRWRTRRSAASTNKGSMPEYLQPSSVAAVRELAELIAAAEWAPSSYRGDDGHYVTEKIVLGIMHGAAVGLGPFAAVHAIAVIDGHPTIWGDGALALVERSGLIEDMREDYVVDGEEGLTAVCIVRRRSWPTPIARRFSAAMAEGAGLTRKEGPWQTYPRRMLMMRARSWALRDGFADVLRGLSIREEVEDYETPLAAPLPVAGELRSGSNAKPPPGRPRFADYIAAANVSEGRKKTKNTALNKVAVVAAEAIATESSPIPAVAPERAMRPGRAINPTNNDGDEGDAEHAPTGPRIEPLEAPEPAHGDLSSYTLVDADGNFIELTSLEALRVAFDDLFSDRSLSEAQVLGLWESNELARQQLITAFGEQALEIAAAHCSAAADRCRRSRPTKQSSRNTIVSGLFLTQTDPKDASGSSAALLELKINPAWSDEKVLHHYQAHLLKMRLRRAQAAAFVDFRLANQFIEDGLRARLPHLMSAIDEVYAWASTEAR
jgi:hypothetical protein